MKIKFTYLIAALTLLFAACNKEDIQYTVNFDSNGGSDVEMQVVSAGDVALEPSAPEREGFNFEGWFHNDTQYDFSTPVNADLTITAQWFIPAGETSYEFADISRASFEAMEMGEEIIVKATITRLGTWPSAWGCEVWLLDSYGNSSKELYDHTPYGMFSFPLAPEEVVFDEEYIFRLYKDTYMSSPQLGFGPKSCFYDWAWQCDYRYGVEYFDDVLRGNVREVNLVEETGVQILLGEDKTVTFPELTETADLEALLGKNVVVYVLEQDGAYSSLLADGELQVYETTQE